NIISYLANDPTHKIVNQILYIRFLFFFSSRRRHTISKRDWSSDVCSSDLPVIEVSHLTRMYGARAAVKDLSFTVEDGQIYGLLGPNGAGKSTIMNILAGYLAATSGTVTVCGHPLPEEAAAARACIGYLPETPPLYPEMTVEEYLRFAAALKGVRRG